MKYAIYARKSSETEDRQMLSIPAQMEEMNKLAERTPDLPKERIELYESKSAKISGRREQFNRLMELIENGEVDTIMVWHADRLSRNPVDSARIIDLMDRKLLIRIITPSQTFLNNPNDKMWLAFCMIQAKYENDKKGVDVVRGMKQKAEMGWYPTVAPLGYINTPELAKGYKTIKNDPLKFALVKRCFHEILAGSQACDVWLMARNEWKLTGQQGGKLSGSTFYNILNNPFYYGEYEWPAQSGHWIQGKHEAMITRVEFDIIQRMLGKLGKPIRRSHLFNLTGLMRCEECGCSITASRKPKHYKKTNRTAIYTYYHCSKKRRFPRCNQKPITESELNDQIKEVLLSIRPPQEFVEWAKKWLRYAHKDEHLFQENVMASRQSALQIVENKLNTLLDMRLENNIDEAVYNEKKRKLESEKHTLEQQLTNTSQDLDDNRRRIENALDLAYAAEHKFKTGTREEKHKLLLDLSSNLTYFNKNIRIHLLNHFLAIQNPEKWEEKYKKRLEPQKYTELLIKNPSLRPANPIWLPRQGSNLRHPR